MAKTSKCAVLKTAIKWKERYCIVTCISYVSREVYRGKNSHEKREKVEILLQVFILSTSLFFFFLFCAGVGWLVLFVLVLGVLLLIQQSSFNSSSWKSIG